LNENLCDRMSDAGKSTTEAAAIKKASAPKKAKGVDPARWHVKGTVAELARNASALFLSATVESLNRNEARGVFRGTGDGGDFLRHNSGDQLYLFILNHYSLPVSGVRLAFADGFTERDAAIAGILIRVFNSDVAAAPAFGRHSETWSSLQQTRIIRVIARLTTFNTDLFLRSLRMVEGARELTYEGKPFATRLLVTRVLKHIAEPAGKRFVRLSTPLPIGTALLGEKWARALTMSGSVALVVLAQRQLVSGVVVLPDQAPQRPSSLHSSFSYLEDLVVDGVALIVATPTGDIWVRLSNGMTFLRRRSRWQYIDLEPVQAMIARHSTPDVAAAMLRMALDASFERRGALLAVIDDPAFVSELVPDHPHKNRSNRGLRDIVHGLDITEPMHAPLLRGASEVDGAILLAPDGKVLDAGCLVVDPPVERIQSLNMGRWRSHPGARSTAARNCSAYGVALKISEDGPISVFEGGRLRLEIG
jgi:hypothetical protein